MRCPVCGNGDRRPARRPYVAQKGSRVAVVTDVPVEECPACGEIWFAEQVALTLDGLLTEMLTTETVAIRPYPDAASSAA
jgi:YgiT-type zinc finger domain-containing protein